jgi:phosphoserine phosphatase RsbU/P
MLQRPWLFPVLFIALTFSSPAQQVDASNTGGPTPLDAPWRLHFGDDPAYAQPGFDDSHWTLHRIDKDWASEGQKGYAGYAWYRMRLILPRGDEPLAIAIYPPADAVEIYIDGALAGTIGRMRPEPVATMLRDVYDIAVPAALHGRAVEVALRVWQTPLMAPNVGAGAAVHPSLLGVAGEVDRIVGLDQQNLWVAKIPDWTVDMLGVAVGLFSFGLFLLQRNAREYAYAAVYFCGFAAANLYYWFCPQTGASALIGVLIFNFAWSVFLCLWLLFTWEFMRAPADRLLYACLAAAWIGTISPILVFLGVMNVGEAYWSYAAMELFLAIAVFVRLYALTRRGNRDAQLFLIPFSLWTLSNCVWSIFHALSTSGIVDLNSAWTLHHGSRFDVTWGQVFELLFNLAVGAVLVLRYARSARQEQRLRTEMEAARRVQGQLVPADLPQFAGFACDAAYRAASEVGGDFYQVFPRPDGSALILVGDVSGKGLRAAMLGTLIVGAAGALAQENLSPAEMLERLNRRLHGSTDGGFATCLCALLSPDGTLSIANAGHLAPYRNGRELPCEPGLPLGILPVAEYAETCVQLDPCDALTFMSDGVVEARSAAGELFGFDRTRDISTQTAEEIARAASTFGQEDDITVLTVRLSAVAATV